VNKLFWMLKNVESPQAHQLLAEIDHHGTLYHVTQSHATLYHATQSQATSRHARPRLALCQSTCIFKLAPTLCCTKTQSILPRQSASLNVTPHQVVSHHTLLPFLLPALADMATRRDDKWRGLAWRKVTWLNELTSSLTLLGIIR